MIAPCKYCHEIPVVDKLDYGHTVVRCMNVMCANYGEEAMFLHQWNAKNTLKPCPFCGHIPDFYGWAGERVYCTNHQTECPATDMPVELWNNRPLEDALQQRIDELTNEKSYH